MAEIEALTQMSDSELARVGKPEADSVLLSRHRRALVGYMTHEDEALELAAESLLETAIQSLLCEHRNDWNCGLRALAEGPGRALNHLFVVCSSAGDQLLIEILRIELGALLRHRFPGLDNDILEEAAEQAIHFFLVPGLGQRYGDAQHRDEENRGRGQFVSYVVQSKSLNSVLGYFFQQTKWLVFDALRRTKKDRERFLSLDAPGFEADNLAMQSDSILEALIRRQEAPSAPEKLEAVLQVLKPCFEELSARDQCTLILDSLDIKSETIADGMGEEDRAPADTRLSRARKRLKNRLTQRLRNEQSQ